MNEYDSLYELGLNWLFWFLIGTIVAYAIFTLLEYFDGRKD